MVFFEIMTHAGRAVWWEEALDVTLSKGIPNTVLITYIHVHDHNHNPCKGMPDLHQ